MSLRSIARNYARALSDTLSDDGELRRVESDLLGFASAMEEIPELREFLAGPIVPAEGKKKAARAILTAGGAAESSGRVIELLIDRHRVALMPEVAEEFSAIASERLGLVDADVTSAAPLSEEMKSKAVAMPSPLKPRTR